MQLLAQKYGSDITEIQRAYARASLAFFRHETQATKRLVVQIIAVVAQYSKDL